MADSSLPEPTNKFVDLLNSILDSLIKGFGADFAYGLIIAQVPWMGGPVIGTIIKGVLKRVAASLDTTLQQNADIVVIRFQNDTRKDAYEQALQPIKEGTPTDAEIKAAKDAIDALVRRSK